MLQDLMVVPPPEVDPALYTDWGDARRFTIGDIGVGECAGEVVSLADFGFAAAENEVFEAQLLLDDGHASRAAAKALDAMLTAAQGLIKIQDPDISNDTVKIVAGFRDRFYDTQLFFDPFAGGKFARYLFVAYESANDNPTLELAHQRVEEAQLFIEAAHACQARLLEAHSKHRITPIDAILATTVA